MDVSNFAVGVMYGLCLHYLAWTRGFHLIPHKIVLPYQLLLFFAIFFLVGYLVRKSHVLLSKFFYGFSLGTSMSFFAIVIYFINMA